MSTPTVTSADLPTRALQGARGREVTGDAIDRQALALLGVDPETPVREARVYLGRGINRDKYNELQAGPHELVLLEESQFVGIEGVAYLIYGSQVDPAPVRVPVEVAAQLRWKRFMEREFLKMSAALELSASLPSDPSRIPDWG